MLKKISVKNYKGFKDEIVLDFSDYKDYKFNTFAIKDGLIKSAMIYGKNGAGKSNFGLAIFDLTLHLTDNEKNPIQTTNYLNGDSDEEVASFSYTFVIDGNEYLYEYKKQNAMQLTYEKLYLNGKKIFSYNFQKHQGDFPGLNLISAESLNIYSNMNISVLRYITFNANLTKDNPISKLMNFISHMLWFRSTTDGNAYIGLTKGANLLIDTIIENGTVKKFEEYLKSKGVNYQLEAMKNQIGMNILVAKYKYRNFDFLETASHGTKILLLYFFWIQQLNNASFVFIDEFDAFYHTFLAQDIFTELATQIEPQLLITTHNTDLLSNNILRPDCYFIVSQGKITSLPNCTERELREGHNLEKMFKAGEFNG